MYGLESLHLSLQITPHPSLCPKSGPPWTALMGLLALWLLDEFRARKIAGAGRLGRRKGWAMGWWWWWSSPLQLTVLGGFFQLRDEVALRGC